MPATRYGGPLPDVKYGFELTVEPPDGTDESNGIAQGELFKLEPTEGASDGSGYKAVPCEAGDTPSSVILLSAKHGLNDSVQDLGVKVLGHGDLTVVRLPYAGTAPTVGQSIAIASGAGNERKVTGKTWAKGDGTIMKVSTATLEVEVLI